jgi:branched-chain amino acid transport system permease protein
MRDLVVFLLLVITLLIKPTGLFGRDIKEKV